MITPSRPCAVPGCTALVQHGSRCPAHQPVVYRARTSARGYDSAWRRLVRTLIAAHPFCARCGTPGSSDNPLTGDHIVPLSAGGETTPENVQVLCRRCNSGWRRGQA